jgi:hypothetical protein
VIGRFHRSADDLDAGVMHVKVPLVEIFNVLSAVSYDELEQGRR